LDDTYFHGFITYTIDRMDGITPTCFIESSKSSKKEKRNIILYNGKMGNLPRRSIPYYYEDEGKTLASTSFYVASSIDNEMIITDIRTCQRMKNITIHQIPKSK
jgi:hypothetical protein